MPLIINAKRLGFKINRKLVVTFLYNFRFSAFRATPDYQSLAIVGVLAYSVLRDWNNMIVSRNNVESNQSICHSHDFCDPNQAMIDALDTFGVDFDCQNEKQGALIDAAWAMAKSKGFQSPL